LPETDAPPRLEVIRRISRTAAAINRTQNQPGSLAEGMTEL